MSPVWKGSKNGYRHTLRSITSRLLLSFRKLSFSLWACSVICSACFFRAKSRSLKEEQKNTSLGSVTFKQLFRFHKNEKCYLASDGAALVVGNFSEKFLCMGLLLLILPTLLFQLLELQVLEALCLCLKYLTVLMRTIRKDNEGVKPSESRNQITKTNNVPCV